MAARWYRASAGQYLSRDTYAGELRTPVSLNRFTYGNNNPTRFWDPTGFLPGDRAVELRLRNPRVVVPVVVAQRHVPPPSVPSEPVGESEVPASRTQSGFGGVIQATVTNTPLGFQGDYTDPSTGDVNMAARWDRASAGSPGTRTRGICGRRCR